MMKIMGIIFSNINERQSFELTTKRTIASMPIGGRYRLIDFPLSNMVNSGITTVGIVTRQNYQSLINYLGSGKEWDLARKKGGLTVLPPFASTPEFYNSRLESLKNIMSYINRTQAEYILLSDGYQINNIDFRELLAFHNEIGSDITCVYANNKHKASKDVNVLDIANDGRINDMTLHKEYKGDENISLDIWFMRKSLLQHLILDAINNEFTSFTRQILKSNLSTLRIYGFQHTGYFGSVNSVDSFYRVNMDLLNEDIRNDLFNQRHRTIYTKIADFPPTKYGESATVVNSIIADGCYIDGHVENSIIFGGTKIKKDAVIKDSIIMHSNVVESNVVLTKIITDKVVRFITENKQHGTPQEVRYIKRESII